MIIPSHTSLESSNGLVVGIGGIFVEGCNFEYKEWTVMVVAEVE